MNTSSESLAKKISLICMFHSKNGMIRVVYSVALVRICRSTGQTYLWVLPLFGFSWLQYASKAVLIFGSFRRVRYTSGSRLY
jgi:hypothetical protein